MRFLHSTIGDLPWVQMGDFNVVLRSSERVGHFDASEFRNCLLILIWRSWLLKVPGSLGQIEEVVVGLI